MSETPTNDTPMLEDLVPALRAAMHNWRRADSAYSAFADALDAAVGREFPLLEGRARDANNELVKFALDPHELRNEEAEMFGNLCQQMLVIEYEKNLRRVHELSGQILAGMRNG